MISTNGNGAVIDKASPIEAFFAYPSSPVSLKEVVVETTTKLNNSGLVSIRTWEDMAIGGQLLWAEIAKEIERSQLFLCDLTGLNKNVLFELGYAIARKKTVWIVYNVFKTVNGLDKSKSAVLRHLGHIGYSNDNDIVQKFFSEQPYTLQKDTLYSALFKQRDEKSKLLYLKSAVPTQASRYLTEAIEASKIPHFIDDPLESPDQPLGFYTPVLSSASSVIIHFLSDDTEDRLLHNQKCALIAGLALGLGKPLLMLGEEPFQTPVDYDPILKKHDTAERCRQLAQEWLDDHKEQIRDFKLARQQNDSNLEAKEELRLVNLGTYAAENERDSLEEYFVETSAYTRSLQAQNALFIGRRGSGKKC